VKYNLWLAERYKPYIQSNISGYVRLARYSRTGAIQREAELCGLSTHQCPLNCLAEIASQMPVEYGKLQLLIHLQKLQTKGRD